MNSHAELVGEFLRLGRIRFGAIVIPSLNALETGGLERRHDGFGDLVDHLRLMQRGLEIGGEGARRRQQNRGRGCRRCGEKSAAGK